MIARQRHERRIAAGFGRNVRHGPHFAGIDVGQEVGQAKALGRVASVAGDLDAEKVDVSLPALIDDPALQAVHRFWVSFL